MKYEIYTIPVWDAINEHSECPFCTLQEQIEAKRADYYLSDSVMQPHIRIRVNETGFCAHHYSMMLKKDRKLSLALMCSTHGMHMTDMIKSSLSPFTSGEASKKDMKTLNSAIDALQKASGKCVICEDIAYDIDRYLHTYVYLYKKDPHLKEEMQKSKGFCTKHFAGLLSAAKSELSGKTLRGFIADAAKVQTDNMERINGEVKWFCDKFDYRNADKPWGNSKDCLPRAVTKLGGKLQK